MGEEKERKSPWTALHGSLVLHNKSKKIDPPSAVSGLKGIDAKAVGEIEGNYKLTQFKRVSEELEAGDRFQDHCQ